MKQHCYEGRVTPIHFFLIWWLIQGVEGYWDREGGPWKSLLRSVAATKSGFLRSLSSWNCLGRISTPRKNKQPPKKERKRGFPRESKSFTQIMKPDHLCDQGKTKYLSKNSGNVMGMWSLIILPATRRSLGESKTWRAGRNRARTSQIRSADEFSLPVPEKSSFHGSALSGEGSWVLISLPSGQRSKGHPLENAQPSSLASDIGTFQNLRLQRGQTQGIWFDGCKLVNKFY